MREDVDGSGDHPILQDETGLTRGTSVRDSKKVIKINGKENLKASGYA